MTAHSVRGNHYSLARAPSNCAWQRTDSQRPSPCTSAVDWWASTELRGACDSPPGRLLSWMYARTSAMRGNERAAITERARFLGFAREQHGPRPSSTTAPRVQSCSNCATSSLRAGRVSRRGRVDDSEEDPTRAQGRASRERQCAWNLKPPARPAGDEAAGRRRRRGVDVTRRQDDEPRARAWARMCLDDTRMGRGGR